jgi:hypothetical protein
VRRAPLGIEPQILHLDPAKIEPLHFHPQAIPNR